MKSQTFALDTITPQILKEIALDIKKGGVAVIPTDTIYGIVGVAKNPETVERIYKLRKRSSSKPMIILISSLKEITHLGIKLSDPQKELLSLVWPGPLSIVIDCKDKNLTYLHRDKNSLAFRLPDNEFLIQLLKITGPLVAPSANFEGEKPAQNINEAKAYFKDSIPIYIDAGDLDSPPSTIAKLTDSKLKILREGAIKIARQFLA